MKRSEAAVKDRVRAVWQAFAAGDACGMPTEFMCPEDIRKVFGDLMPGGLPEGILPAERSLTHGILETGAVTDDTEQKLYLLAEAKKRGGVPNCTGEDIRDLDRGDRCGGKALHRPEQSESARIDPEGHAGG